MSWSIIFEVLLKVFGPILGVIVKKLLDKLFSKAKKNLANEPVPDNSEEAIKKAFSAAESNLPKIAPARRLLLRRLRAISLKHSDKVVRGEHFELSSDDQEEIKLAGLVVSRE